MWSPEHKKSMSTFDFNRKRPFSSYTAQYAKRTQFSNKRALLLKPYFIAIGFFTFAWNSNAISTARFALFIHITRTSVPFFFFFFLHRSLNGRGVILGPPSTSEPLLDTYIDRWFSWKFIFTGCLHRFEIVHTLWTLCMQHVTTNGTGSIHRTAEK